MAVDSTFRAIISVVDRTAGPLAAINDRIERLPRPISRLGESFAGVGAQISRLAQNTGFGRLGSAIAGAGREVRSLGGHVGSLVGMLGLPGLATLGGLAAGAATTGLGILAFNTAKAAGDLDDLANRTGISGAALQRYQGLAVRAGLETEVVGTSFQKLARGMGDAAVGKNKDMAALFARLRIPLRDARGRVRDVTAVLPALADAFARTTNQATRVRMATALFGKTGESLIPMLAQGGAEMAKTADNWEHFSRSMSDTERAMGAAADESFENLTFAVKGLGAAIGFAVLPVLAPMADEMAQWVVQNREWIATEIGAKVQALAGFLRDVVWPNLRDFDWRGFGEGVSALVTKVGEFVDKVGGMQNVLIGFGAIAVAPFLLSLGQIAFALVGVTLGAGRALLALRSVATAAIPAAVPGLTASGAVAGGGSSVASLAGPAAAAVPGLGGTLAGNAALFDVMRRVMPGGDMRERFRLPAERRLSGDGLVAPAPGALPAAEPGATAPSLLRGPGTDPATPGPGLLRRPEASPATPGPSLLESLRAFSDRLDASTGFGRATPAATAGLLAPAGVPSTAGLIAPRTGAAATGPAPPPGKIEVDFMNVQPGVRITDRTPTGGPSITLDVGRSMQGAGQ